MAFVYSSYAKLRTVLEQASDDSLPLPSAIVTATRKLPTSLPLTGLGEDATQAHLLSDICPGFNGPKTSSNYYGFVTGGVFPIAEVADNLVTAFDQNVQVHLPDQSVSTIVEDRALSMITELVNLGDGWKGRTFTTGGTGANILGLACGREAVVTSRLQAIGETRGVGELGLLVACTKANIKEIQVLTTLGHSSLYKAASVVGLGRASIKDIPVSKKEPWHIDINALESELKRSSEGVVSIVAISAGEVNTGHYATTGRSSIQEIRTLCDKYGAWLHADGAFGLFARCLPETPEFQTLLDKSSGIELADSIAGDCHKLLNVPYDCGLFLTRSPNVQFEVFQNANAAYLSSGPVSIPSPLNIGLENSRRFRALPVYAVLLAYGRKGLSQMLARQVRLSRAISAYIDSNPSYELLAQAPKTPPPTPKSRFVQPTGTNTPAERLLYEHTHMIVIFRAKDETLNEDLVKRINETRKIYVSGTKWEGKPACRIAVSTWKVDVLRDIEVVRGVLGGVVREFFS